MIGFGIFLLRAICSQQETVGYLENWGPMTKWWDNVIPGNCDMGCEKPKQYMAAIANYTTVNYGFTFLTETPNPEQNSCGTCPVWDGKGIYIANYNQWQTKAAVVTISNDNLVTPNSGAVSISEACRLARMGPYDTPKRCSIALGGWSDWARMATVENAQKIAKLVGKMVLSTFADGIDLDFEHLTPFNGYSKDDEFAAFSALIKAIRAEFNAIPDQYQGFAEERTKWLNVTYNKLPNWEKAQGQYFPANMQYMKDISSNIDKNGPPKLVISWCTRFNAFVPEDDPYNYLLPDSPVPSSNFATDNEGPKFWNDVKDYVDKVNIMAYDAGSDAGPLKLNFTQILLNFVAGGVPSEKINIGFEPGKQAAEGIWEGLTYDVGVTKFVKDNNYGGSMVWAINDEANSRLDKELIDALSQVIPPVYPSSPIPTYTKVDPNTGYLPKNRKVTA
jgi:hypothetical protein